MSMPDRPLKLGTRRSALALWQANHVRDRLRAHWGDDLQIELVEIVTQGDRILDRPLSEVGGKGLFVNGIEEQLADGRVDFAVHSMKDLPSALGAGLSLVATPEREDPRDVLVGPPGATLATLPDGARVGTSSLRRGALARRTNGRIEVVPVRGNVPTRIDKTRDGTVDAVILAAAGIVRLGRAEEITEYLDPEDFLPAAAQGILALEARDDDVVVRDVLAALDHAETATVAATERAFLARLDGGCQVPMACHAVLDADGTIQARAAILDPVGAPAYFVRDRAARSEAIALGTRLAESLLELGAGAVIDELAGRTPDHA